MLVEDVHLVSWLVPLPQIDYDLQVGCFIRLQQLQTGAARRQYSQVCCVRGVIKGLLLLSNNEQNARDMSVLNVGFVRVVSHIPRWFNKKTNSQGCVV
jgi:hypothetical protein